MKLTKKLLLVVILIMAMVFSLFAQSSTPGVTDKEIKIGTFAALSGPLAVVGVPFVKGMKAYYNWVNANGGVFGRKIKLIVEDDQFNPAKSLLAVKKLVEQDKVFAIVGALGTPGCLAVLPYLVENNVPFVYQGSGSSKFAFPPKKYVFSVQPNYVTEGKIHAVYAANVLKAKKAYDLYTDDEGGKEEFASFSEKAKELGMKVKGSAFKKGELDFSTYMLKIRSYRPDIIVIHSISVVDTANILKKIKEYGIKAKMITTYPNADPILVKLAGDPEVVEGLYVTGWVPVMSPDDKDFKKYMEIYKATYNDMPNAFTSAGFIAAEVFVAALKRLGKNLTRETFVNAMETLRGWDGILAKKIEYGPDLRVGKTSMYFLQFQDGKLKTVSDWIKGN